MQQINFIFDYDETSEIKNIVKISIYEVKNRFPKPMKGETLEDYKTFIRDEILLEISERLRSIALRRQKNRINILNGGGND